MKYELAKKLKDAGFSQREPTFTKFNESTWESVYEPHLSELIEACEKISTIKRTGLDGAEKWSADATDYPEVYGETPEEAVAKLYLALNNNET